jgi:hypothetical protein
MTPDGSQLYFTRRSKKRNKYDGPGAPMRSVEEFSVSQVKGERSGMPLFEEGQALTSPFNSQYNEGGPTMTADNKLMVFTICERNPKTGKQEGGATAAILSWTSKNKWSRALGLHFINTPSNLIKWNFEQIPLARKLVVSTRHALMKGKNGKYLNPEAAAEANARMQGGMMLWYGAYSAVIAGKITRYDLSISASLILKNLNDNKIVQKTFIRNRDYDISSNYSKTVAKEKSTIKIITQQLTDDITQFIKLLMRNK